MKPYDYMYLVPKDQYESKTSADHGGGREPLARVGGDLQESQFNQIDVSNGGTVIIREGIQGGVAPLPRGVREDSAEDCEAWSSHGEHGHRSASRSGKKRSKEEEEEEEEETTGRRHREPQAYRRHGRHASPRCAI